MKIKLMKLKLDDIKSWWNTKLMKLKDYEIKNKKVSWWKEFTKLKVYINKLMKRGVGAVKIWWN